ncbi:MAG TPA: class I SAM-dependent methyltransferase [Vicinamibacterales bacterium]|nr:class I SAM-dependent methyltransferase [Vicinamibacterales bacterium]
MTAYPRSSAAFLNPASMFADDGREYPACALCEERRTRLLVIRKGFHVVRCETCSLVYVSPRPKRQREIDALYTNRKYSTRQVSHAVSTSRMREAHWRLARVEEHAPARGRLLDVGCSAGSFLLAARERGWHVRGIDISPGAVEHASTAHGLDVRVATLEDAAFSPAAFDVITLFECIEHMLHPSRALTSAHRLLRDGGLLVITTPNVDGFVPRVTYQLLGRTIGAWEHPTPPHHLYQFSRRTLDALLQKAGFSVVSCRTRPMGLTFTVKQLQSAIIDALARRMPSSLKSSRASHESGIAPRDTLSRPQSLSRQLSALARKTARTAIAGICWTLGLALYALPLHHAGAGDSMIVVARK